jgi:cation diffusion facilitator CzcD-associated flavoprotein CzcO
LYPGLKTNNHFGSFEFSDLRMDSSGFGENAHIPGPLVHNYLYTWAEKHDLLRLIRLGCSVQTAEDRNENGWILTVMSEVDPTQLPATVHAAKLVISTGLTSQPFLPKFRGGDDFEAPIYHSSDFAKECKNLGSFRKVAILGGNKVSHPAHPLCRLCN